MCFFLLERSGLRADEESKMEARAAVQSANQIEDLEKDLKIKV